MALDKLSSLMILVCVIALIILLSLVVFTWVKWHLREVRQPRAPIETATPAIEITSPNHPPAHFQQGYLNTTGKDSPNLSGSRTFLNEDVLKQKPFPKDAGPVPEFQSKDVVFHANAERNPNELQSGDIVFHANGPFADNKTTNELQAGHLAYNNTDGTSVERRWTESMVPKEDEDDSDASHRKNTYL